jgi:hypothetical protein
VSDVIESRRNRQGRWGLWLLAAIVVVLTVAAVAAHRTAIPSFSKSLAASPTAAIPKDDPREDDGWVLGDVQLNPSWSAMTARIANQTQSIRSTYFTVTVLSDGHLVGAFSGALNDIEPGATATATLIGPKIPADTTNYTYELQAG